MHSDNPMAVSAKATLNLRFQDEKKLVASMAALKPEVNSSVTRRAKINLESHGNMLVLSIDAEDTVALRATVNAYLRWMASTISVLDSVENLKFLY